MSGSQPTGGLTMRDPLRLKQWDEMACETACTAQILYVYGLMEESDISSIDRTIGRRPNKPDVRCGNIRLLLERGLHLRSITPVTPEAVTGPGGVDLLRKLWLEVGRSQKEIDEDLPKVFPDIVASFRQSMPLMRRFRSQITTVQRMSTKKDLRDMLRQGHIVFCTQLASNGTTHAILAIPEGNSSNTCLVYDPAIGNTRRFTFDQLDRNVVSYGNGWRLP